MSCWEGLFQGDVGGGGPEGQRQKPEMEETEVLGYFCDWCGRVVLWTSEAGEENTASFFRSRAQGETGRIFFLTSA